MHRVTLSCLCQCGQNLIKFITRYLLHLTILESNFFKKKQLKIEIERTTDKGFYPFGCYFCYSSPSSGFYVQVFHYFILKTFWQWQLVRKIFVPSSKIWTLKKWIQKVTFLTVVLWVKHISNSLLLSFNFQCLILDYMNTTEIQICILYSLILLFSPFFSSCLNPFNPYTLYWNKGRGDKHWVKIVHRNDYCIYFS